MVERKYKWNTATTAFTTEEIKAMEGRPKLLFAAIESPMYSSEYMVEGFEKAGYSTTKINWQSIRFNEGVTPLNDLLIHKVKSERPKVSFLHIQTPDILYIDTLKEMSKYSFVVLYTFDVRTDIKWMKDLAPYVGLILFSDLESIAECKKDGILNVGHLLSSADYFAYRKIDIRESTNEYGEVVFIGNNYINSPQLGFEKAEERVEMVSLMEKTFKHRFKVYGLNWEGEPRLTYPHMEALIYNSAKVAITHNNFLRGGYQSDRAFRAMGCGIYTVAQYYPGINLDFNPSVLATWLNFEMLATEVERALSNDKRRKVIADAGHDYVRQVHTWQRRVEKMTELIAEEQKRRDVHVAAQN